MEYYNNYLLDCYLWELSSLDRLYLDAVIWMVDNKYSLRCTERNFLVSKSSLHRFINGRLKTISFELYKCARKVLKANR